MSGQVLIVDSVPARSAPVRTSLRAAHYDVTHASDVNGAPALVAVKAPDLLVIDLGEDGAGATAAIAAVKARPGAATPVIALCPPDRPDLRLLALGAGADEAMNRGAPDRLLQARIRSLLRARDAAAEMSLREEEEAAEAFGGFAEGRAAFLGPAEPCEGRIAVVLAGQAADRAGNKAPGAAGALPTALAHLPGALSCEVAVLSAGEDPSLAGGGVPDLFVIDGSEAAADSGARAEVLRLLADLRSRSHTRHAATLVVLPEDAVETAVMALDLGAGDVAADAARPEEIAARARALIGRKSRADRLRDRIQSRLQAAVRDPLTGLYNRRYAEPTLARMAAQARATGRDFAMMVLDIDHFKAINDTWGHAAGDCVLAEVARRLQGAVRGNDLVARIGGEEFLVAMTDTTPEAARAAAERLRRAIDGRPFEVESSDALWREPELVGGARSAWGRAMAVGDERRPRRVAGQAMASPFGPGFGPGPARATSDDLIRVSVSIGVAVGAPHVADGPGLPDLFEKADAALYAAKAAGRNTVSMARDAA
jgi:two-component system cell cycle response regulator